MTEVYQARVYRYKNESLEFYALVSAETFGQLMNILLSQELCQLEYSIYFSVTVDKSHLFI